MSARTVSILIVMASCALVGQEPRPQSSSPVIRAVSDPATELIAFEKEMEAAVVRGDVTFLSRVCTSDFIFTHGDGWTTGRPPLRVENKTQWLKAVGEAPYLSRNLDSVQVELHGDVAITIGKYRARYKVGAPGRTTFTVWFERVYVRRDGRWQFMSHRTVHGPTFES